EPRIDRDANLLRRLSARASVAQGHPQKGVAGPADRRGRSRGRGVRSLSAELLSDFQITIPEFGTVSALTIPRVVLTSNGTREWSDALRRRCLYHYLDFPDVDREAAILRARQPSIDASFALQVARMVAGLRREELRKRPGIAETLDWAA